MRREGGANLASLARATGQQEGTRTAYLLATWSLLRLRLRLTGGRAGGLAGWALPRGRAAPVEAVRPAQCAPHDVVCLFTSRLQFRWCVPGAHLFLDSGIYDCDRTEKFHGTRCPK